MSSNPLDAKSVQAQMAAKSWKDPAFRSEN